MNIEIVEVKKSEIKTITDIALPAWEATYLKIVSKEQFDFMYNEMYSVDSLEKQFEAGHRFFVLYENKTPAAFVSFVPAGNTIRIPKLYVHPAHQKKGFGKMLIDKVEEINKEDFEVLELNVNRYNPAKFFYEKIGFEIDSKIDVPIGKYFMNDYIMKKKIQQSEI